MILKIMKNKVKITHTGGIFVTGGLSCAFNR